MKEISIVEAVEKGYTCYKKEYDDIGEVFLELVELKGGEYVLLNLRTRNKITIPSDYKVIPVSKKVIQERKEETAVVIGKEKKPKGFTIKEVINENLDTIKTKEDLIKVLEESNVKADIRNAWYTFQKIKKEG